VRSCRWVMFLVLLQATPAVAQSAWETYSGYMDGWMERAGDLDLYGVTAQLPQGVFSMKYEWNTRTADGRYNNHRDRTAMVEPITFGEEENPLLVLDLGVSGGGGGVTMQFAYGITDPLDFYFELPMQYANVQMRPKLTKLDPSARTMINAYASAAGYPQAEADWFNASGQTTDRYMNEAAAWFLGYLPRLGRPAMYVGDTYPEDLGPGKEYNTNGWVLGDINLGLSWNYKRSSRWSGALTGRVYLPTGSMANPNSSLTLGTGPGLDRGTGSFGVGFTKGYDVRVFKYEHWVDIILSAEFTGGYFFKSKRRYPDFPKPTTDGNQLLDLLDAERLYFPDMSDLTGGSYEYTPGVGLAASFGVSVAVLMFDVGATVGYRFFQEPELNADWRFERMVKNLEMQAAGHTEILRLAAGVNLLPLYIPLRIHYQFEKAIGGRNTLIFTDNHWITVQGYIPTF